MRPLKRHASRGQAEDSSTLGGAWQYKYDRRLTDIRGQDPISDLVFSEDGQWLITCIGPGDPKIWDSRTWAKTATLSGHDPKATVSAVRCCLENKWLVSVQDSGLKVFGVGAPWRLERARISESSKWCCTAFQPPGADGDGRWSRRLAAASSSHLCVLDYSRGWTPDVLSERSHSMLPYERTICISFTPSGDSLLCALASGHLLVWDSHVLSLDRTLHVGLLIHLITSPACADYESRLFSCGADNTVRVWRPSDMVQELRIQPEGSRSSHGVRRCVFSATGSCMLTLGEDLCVWKVRRSFVEGEALDLYLYQCIQAVGSVEGWTAAGFCRLGEEVVAGSSDGSLALWKRVESTSLPEPSATWKKDSPATVKVRPGDLEQAPATAYFGPRMHKVGAVDASAPSAQKQSAQRFSSESPASPSHSPPTRQNSRLNTWSHTWSHSAFARPVDATTAELARIRLRVTSGSASLLPAAPNVEQSNSPGTWSRLAYTSDAMAAGDAARITMSQGSRIEDSSAGKRGEKTLVRQRALLTPESSAWRRTESENSEGPPLPRRVSGVSEEGFGDRAATLRNQGARLLGSIRGPYRSPKVSVGSCES